MFIMQSAEIFGDSGSSGIACPDKHIRHAFFVSPSPLDRWRGSVPLLRFPHHWRTRNGQCVSYLYYRPFFTRGSKVLPLFFLCKVGMKRLCGKGAFLLSQKFFKKNGTLFHFFQAREGRVFKIRNFFLHVFYSINVITHWYSVTIICITYQYEKPAWFLEMQFVDLEQVMWCFYE